MKNFFTFSNDGQKIIETNYWDSEHAKNGYFFLSWNACAARLLVPDTMKSAINEMKSAEYVIISHGKLIEHSNRSALELLFEDHSDAPYCIHLVEEQTDRLIPETEQGGGFDVVVWTKEGEILRLPGKHRKVGALPFMQQWEEH